MSKKFNGERCERRNLTDLVLGTGPTGLKRPVSNKKKNQLSKPSVPQMPTGGPTGGSPLDRNDPQFQSWLQTNSREFYPEYSGEALKPTEWFKYVNPYTDAQKYPSNIAVNPTLLPQAASSRYMTQEIGRASSPGAKRMTMTDAYSANEQRYNENRETEQLYLDWLSRQGSAPPAPGRQVSVAEDGKSFNVSGPASQMPHGGPTHVGPWGPEAVASPGLAPTYAPQAGIPRDALGRPVQDPSQMSYSMQAYGFEDGPITPTSNPLETLLFAGPGRVASGAKTLAQAAAKPAQIMGNKALKYGAEALNSALPLGQRVASGLKSAYNGFGVYQLPSAVTGFVGGAANQIQGKGSVGNTVGMVEDVVNVLPGSKVLKTALTKGVTAKEGIKIGEDLTTGDYGSAFGRAAIGLLPGDQSRVNPSQATTYGMKWANKLWDSKPQESAQMTYGGPASPVDSLLGVLARKSSPGYTSSGNMPTDTQALLEYFNAAQGRITGGMSPRDAANTNAYLMQQQMDHGLPATAQAMYGTERKQMNPGGPTMTPGQLPDFIKQYLEEQGKLSLGSSAGQAVGQFITQNSDTVDDPMAKYGIGEGIGAAVSGATNPLAMSMGPAGMLVGAGVGALMGKHNSNLEKNRFIAAKEKLGNETEALNVANAEDFSAQTLSTYNQDGTGGGYYSRYGGPVDRFYMGGTTKKPYAMGGPIDYETEKEEVILASSYDRPVAPGQGSYNQLSENLFKGNGPSHAQGGIPTRGATQPFVDGEGRAVDSPYVFSDSKDMRFDPNDILSMIT